MSDEPQELAPLPAGFDTDKLEGAEKAVKGVTEMDALVVYLQQLGILLKQKR